MKRAVSIIALLVLGAILGVSSASAQTTYNWTPLANGRNVDGVANAQHRTLALTVPAKVTVINITSSRLIGPGQVNYDYTVTSGPAVTVGEVVEACCGIPNGMFKVLSVQTDPANDSLQMTVAENTDDAYPNSGTANVGPPLIYNLTFDGSLSDAYGHPLPGASCVTSESSVTAYFLDANGNLQSVTSLAGSVSCGPNTTTGTLYTGIKLHTAGQFTGTGTDGNQHTITFEMVNSSNTRTGLFYAQSVQWTVN